MIAPFRRTQACRFSRINRIAATGTCWCLLVTVTAGPLAAETPREVDLLLRGGVLADGTAALLPPPLPLAHFRVGVPQAGA